MYSNDIDAWKVCFLGITEDFEMAEIEALDPSVQAHNEEPNWSIARKLRLTLRFKYTADDRLSRSTSHACFWSWGNP